VTWSRGRVEALARLRLDGYVLKKDSPSCGMERLKVYGRGAPTRSGRGLFAQALIEAMPNLPVEEEGRLNDPALRENFVERVFAYQRLADFFASEWTIGGLVAFHTASKFQLLAHGRPGYAELGRLVAGASNMPREAVASDYRRVFMATLKRTASRGRHADVLTHVLGHLKTLLDATDRDELLQAIDDHRRGLVPLIVPITLIRHHQRRLDVEYLRNQVYLDPHPRELALRNHV